MTTAELLASLAYALVPPLLGVAWAWWESGDVDRRLRRMRRELWTPRWARGVR